MACWSGAECADERHRDGARTERRGPDDDEGPADPGHEPAGRLGRHGTPDGERRHAERGVQRAEAQPALEVERQHQRQSRQGGEVGERQHDTGGVRRAPEQPQVDQRVQLLAGEPPLPPPEEEQERRGRDHQQHDRPAEQLGLDGAEEDAERRRPQHQRTDHVQPVATGGRGLRQEPPAQQDDRDPDRDVDEEDQPPAEVRPAERDQGATDERSEGGAEPHRGAERTEGAAALLAAEHLLDQARDLRVDQTSGDALEHPRDDQDLGGRRQPGEGAGDREARDPDLEHQPPAVVVTEPTGQHRDQSEGERVAADDPLQLRGAGSGRAADRGQRDVGDADVEQGHEQRAAAHEQRDPTAVVGLDVLDSPGLRRRDALVRELAHRVIRRARPAARCPCPPRA